MSHVATELLTAVLKLGDGERSELAERIWDSLEPAGSDGIADEEFEAELNRRYEEARRDPTVLIPWDTVRDMR